MIEADEVCWRSFENKVVTAACRELSISPLSPLPVPAGQIVTERDPAHWAGFEIWVGLAGITDNVSLSALEDFLGRPGQLQTDRALQQTVGRPGQSSG